MAQKEHLTKQIELSSHEAKDEQSSDEDEEEVQNKLYAVFATNCPKFHIPGLSDLSNKKEKDTILKRFDILGFDLSPESDERKKGDNEPGIECLEKQLESLMTNDQDSFGCVHISHDDVDFDGKLIDDDLIPSYIKERLRENVELRFDFYGSKKEESDSSDSDSEDEKTAVKAKVAVKKEDSGSDSDSSSDSSDSDSSSDSSILMMMRLRK
jgi:hypothetical protein